MTPQTLKELQNIQADLVVLEGMIKVLIRNAYSGKESPVLIGNSLEVLAEFLGTRADRLDSIIGV